MAPPAPSTLRPGRAFSLVELLVALAIIAVLAALVLPAWQSARHGSRKTACASHLHQIGIAMREYAGDHNGMVPSGYSLTAGYGYTWQNDLAPYTGSTKWQGAGTAQPAIYLCPEVAPFKSGVNEHGGYVMPRRTSGNPAWPPLAAIPAATKTVLLFDGNPQTPSQYISTQSDVTNQVKYRHLGRTSLLMLDGHVENDAVQDVNAKWFSLP